MGEGMREAHDIWGPSLVAAGDPGGACPLRKLRLGVPRPKKPATTKGALGMPTNRASFSCKGLAPRGFKAGTCISFRQGFAITPSPIICRRQKTTRTQGSHGCYTGGRKQRPELDKTVCLEQKHREPLQRNEWSTGNCRLRLTLRDSLNATLRRRRVARFAK
jgi:hypothetical protein